MAEKETISIRTYRTEEGVTSDHAWTCGSCWGHCTVWWLGEEQRCDTCGGSGQVVSEGHVCAECEASERQFIEAENAAQEAA